MLFLFLYVLFDLFTLLFVFLSADLHDGPELVLLEAEPAGDAGDVRGHAGGLDRLGDLH